ncbi:hypothetical protein Ddye_009950 [Dipteronia dyeriana]|uniref:GDSL esterase/lipase n=1 Tax=Dipteronia dyeriana TaxID=168575 RepID=A0AAD9XCM3_9ROSI|nr:hypothetical protein Ddye_009950 [Dipteronia dyeriana]
MRFSTWVFLFLFTGSVAIEASKLFEAPVFIFGDSTVDVGTNNFLPVRQEIKANFPYNGIDYPYSEPTGRFSNGYNIADQIVRLLGYKRSPPAFLYLLNHASSFKKKILQGVNFASGGSGILDGTGGGFNNSMSLGKQIQQFVTVHSNITELRGTEETADMLSNSLFLISAGSNDIFDYLRINGNPSLPDFLTTIHSTYHDHLKSLYDLGARKFGIISVPPTGCCPLLRTKNSTGGCFEVANEYAQSFYNAAEDILRQLSSELPGMTYSLGNLYEMTMIVIEDQYAFGFKNIDRACCGSALSQCNQNASLCWNRDEYLFWDWVHPTQLASRLAALTLYGGSTRFVTPMNFSQLAGVDV